MFEADVNSMQDAETFVKWVGLLITWLQPAADVITSNKSPVWLFLSEEHYFECYALKSPQGNEHDG